MLLCASQIPSLSVSRTSTDNGCHSYTEPDSRSAREIGSKARYSVRVTVPALTEVVTTLISTVSASSAP